MAIIDRRCIPAEVSLAIGEQHMAAPNKGPADRAWANVSSAPKQRRPVLSASVAVQLEWVQSTREIAG